MTPLLCRRHHVRLETDIAVAANARQLRAEGDIECDADGMEWCFNPKQAKYSSIHEAFR